MKQKPTSKLRALVFSLAKLDDKRQTTSEIAKSLSTSRTSLWRWCRKPEVQEELAKVVDSEARLAALRLLRTLLMQAINGDTKAMKKYLEITGILDPVSTVRYLARIGITPEKYKGLYMAFASKYAKNCR